MFCLEAVAGDVEDKTKALAGLRGKIKEVTQGISKLKLDKTSLRSELRSLEEKYGESVSQLARIEQEIYLLNESIEENARQQQVKLQKIKSQKQSLKNQVRAAYGMGKHERLKLMLNQKVPAVSGRVMTYYGYLNIARLEKISDISLDLQDLRDLELQQNEEAELLNQNLTARKQSQLALKKTRAERKVVLAKINKQFRSKELQLKEFKRNEAKLASLIYSLQQKKESPPILRRRVKEFTQMKGRLSWPIKGKLVKKFGARRSDGHWDGVLIQAKEGTEVMAVARGEVVYAGWLRGYGLLTIIKHDKGYMTLYAFNQSLYKTKGDKVEVGAVISTVGFSDGRTNAGLYFGIRKKNKPVNPVKWCKKVRRGKVG